MSLKNSNLLHPHCQLVIKCSHKSEKLEKAGMNTPCTTRRKSEKIIALDDENLEVVMLEMWSKSIGSKIVGNTNDHEELVAESDNKEHFKDKHSIPNAAYHKVAMRVVYHDQQIK